MAVEEDFVVYLLHFNLSLPCECILSTAMEFLHSLTKLPGFQLMKNFLDSSVHMDY